MTFELKDLKRELDALVPGDATGIAYEAYAEIFPPGEPDHLARQRAFVFARSCGCTIDNKPNDEIVYFVKSKQDS
ncbi:MULTISPECIES: hypothetical protein [unclassified Bradyrhizobium]|uniref:hypothetical protein n=1 Tax=unclassified Bradyrhizobium TaxID=2631580 RepID=UPI0028E5A20C|nr:MULTISPECIES: hypothetical protein [unclassified Bradyrhizobium]